MVWLIQLYGLVWLGLGLKFVKWLGLAWFDLRFWKPV
jgi:hypothetical protein